MQSKDIDVQLLYAETAEELGMIVQLQTGLSSGFKNVAPPGSPSNSVQYLDQSGDFLRQLQQTIVDAAPNQEHTIGRPAITKI